MAGTTKRTAQSPVPTRSPSTYTVGQPIITPPKPPVIPPPQKPTWLSPSVNLGCDPELFIVNKQGVVVGSERVLLGGLNVGSDSSIVTDGVQVELHPHPGSCREGLSFRIQQCVLDLDTYIKSRPDLKGLRLSFDPMVEVAREELERLSPKAQTLGCQPSLNIYGHKTKEVNGMEYRKRSAAGHIHLGMDMEPFNLTQLIPLLDLFVANTCVLFDRDPASRERRQLYGKAGEYRLPSHGLEYRVLSNFWLRHYSLMSCVFGLARQAVVILYTAGRGNADGYCVDGYTRMTKDLDTDSLQHAINENDYDVAKGLYEKHVKPMLRRSITSSRRGCRIGFHRILILS